jgi:hypothetical protein
MFAAPMPPSLTTGLAPPEKLDADRQAYEKALTMQLQKQVDAVKKEAEIQKAMIDQQGRSEIQQFELQAKERLSIQCLEVDHVAQNQIRALQQAAVAQRTGMEERAAVAACQYNSKKAMEDMARQAYSVQRHWYEQEAKLAAQYQQVKAAGAVAAG